MPDTKGGGGDGGNDVRKQTDKIIIYVTRSVHGDSQENDWVSLIHIELMIMTDIFAGRIFQITS